MKGMPRRRSEPVLTGDALAEAFPNLSPSRRLAMVEKAIRIEAASRRRRRRLARAARPSPLPWLMLLVAGLVCAAVGLWNIQAGNAMLTQLALYEPADGAGSGREIWSAGQVRAALAHVIALPRQAPPDPLLPLEGPGRAAAIEAHRQRGIAYRIVGVALAGVGGAVAVASLIMAIARRE